MKILIAVDGSPFSEATLTEVARRPWPAGSEVMIVTAFDAPVAASPDLWTLPSDYFEQVERSVQLRAERAEGLNGRVYTISVKVTDSSGNVRTASRTVTVQIGPNMPAVDNGAAAGYTVISNCGP